MRVDRQAVLGRAGRAGRRGAGGIVSTRTVVGYRLVHMSFRRAALYVGGACLLAAWFSSAASLSRQPSTSPVGETVTATSGTEEMAESIRDQARRLRERMGAAPLPEQPVRNPFAFRERPARRGTTAARAVATVMPTPAPFVAPEPVLSLIGVAERQGPSGPARTAMIATAGDELLMVGVGDSVLGRYTVTAIGPDAAQLSDVTTGATRRLALR